MLIIGPKTPTSNNLEHCLTLDGCSVDSASSVRNLGVLFDSNLCIFHLKNISKLRPMLSMSNAEILIHAFMTSRLDYCNALLGGCSARFINKLQMIQNAAARVLTRTRKYDHISPVLSTLHWLPTKHRIDFKILLITYKALNGLAPQYLSELLSHYSPSRPLRSQNSGHLIIPRISKSTAGGRSFSYLVPKLWNNLPNTVREADTLCQFKSRLKVFNEPKRTHVTPLFISLHWLPVAARIKFKTLMLAYRTTTGSAPSYFHSLLRIYIPSRSLRSASERRLVVPSQRGSKSLSRTFSFTIPGWWNNLPTPIRNAGSLSIFKQQLKTHLFRHYLTS